MPEKVKGHATLKDVLDSKVDIIDKIDNNLSDYGANDGVDTIHGLGEITAYEEQLVADMLPDLIAQAEKGVAFGK